MIDGKIFGRGVSDMKAGLAASIAAFCLLGELREAWRGRVTLAAVADEETMGPWGANYLVDHHPRLRGDAALIGEPSTPRTVRFGEKGMSYEILHLSEPNWTSPDLEWMRTVRQAAARVTGQEPFFNISGPGTDSRVFRRVGIPVAVFGPTPHGMGQPDEHVTVDDYLDTVRVHALAALEFLRASVRP